MKMSVSALLLAVLGACMVYGSAGQGETPASAELSARANEFVGLLAKEDFGRAAKGFDSTMKGALPPERLKAAWKSVASQVGAFKRQVALRTVKYQQYDIVFVTCEFERGFLDVKVLFNSAGQVGGLWFVPAQRPADLKPPPYAKPDSFQEKQVLVGSGKWALPGTLSVPVGEGRFPALVLVHGSGPHDRDETIGFAKPFRDLAWGLASRGIAVLRYEKRTKAHTAKVASLKNVITVRDETIDDALAAISLLRKREEIDPENVFVLGHSLGGVLVPRIGKLDPHIAGFIVMAGTTRPLEDVVLAQMSYVFGLDGALSEEEKAELEKIRRQVAKVKAPDLSVKTPGSELPMGVPAAYWLDLRGYHPAEEAKNLKQPMLILQGGRDYQVTLQDFQGWKRSLSSRKDVTFKLYPKLNHLFMEGEGKSTPAEYLKPGHVVQSVVETIADWILAQTGRK